MKSILKSLLLFFVCLLLCSTTVFAHGGKTDFKGGHKDNHNASGLGSYHYHCDGYPAHLHTDGICPYSPSESYTPSESEKLKTEPSNQITYYPSELNSAGRKDDAYIKAAQTVPEQTESQLTDHIESVFYGSCALAVLAGILSFILSALNKRKSADVFSTIAKYSFLLFMLMFLFPIIGGMALVALVFVIPGFIKKIFLLITGSKNNEFIDNRKEPPENNQTDLLVSKDSVCEFDWDIDDDLIIPPGYVIGSLGLPADEDAPKHWGKTFTVYVEPNTNLYHRGRCHCVTPERTYPSHILLAAKNNEPCSLCNPEMPDMSWYYNLLDSQK